MELLGKIALTCGVVVVVCLLVDLLVRQEFPTVNKVTAFMGGASIVGGIMCGALYVLASIWGVP